MAAVKLVYCPSDIGGALDELFKLIINDVNYKILGHHNYLNYVCKDITTAKALTLSKLLAAALNPVGEDPLDTAVKIVELDKDEWVMKALLGALSINRVRFSPKDLLTFANKLQ
jgi:hypothetical protein